MGSIHRWSEWYRGIIGKICWWYIEIYDFSSVHTSYRIPAAAMAVMARQHGAGFVKIVFCGDMYK
jgi:hypothetical protein